MDIQKPYFLTYRLSLKDRNFSKTWKTSPRFETLDDLKAWFSKLPLCLCGALFEYKTHCDSFQIGFVNAHMQVRTYAEDIST